MVPRPGAPGKEEKEDMGLYLRRGIWWFSKMEGGKRVQHSTGTAIKKLAKKIYAKFVVELA